MAKHENSSPRPQAQAAKLWYSYKGTDIDTSIKTPLGSSVKKRRCP